jgi:hypothetical protein
MPNHARPCRRKVAKAHAQDARPLDLLGLHMGGLVAKMRVLSIHIGMGLNDLGGLCHVGVNHIQHGTFTQELVTCLGILLCLGCASAQLCLAQCEEPTIHGFEVASLLAHGVNKGREEGHHPPIIARSIKEVSNIVSQLRAFTNKMPSKLFCLGEGD